MAFGNEHAAIPRIAGKRDQLGNVGKRLSRNAKVHFGAHGVLGDLHGIALTQQQSHLRIAFGESLQYRRENVARLHVGRRDRQRAGVLALELCADAF